MGDLESYMIGVLTIPAAIGLVWLITRLVPLFKKGKELEEDIGVIAEKLRPNRTHKTKDYDESADHFKG